MKRLGLIVIIAAATCSAQNWPQFRGPQASGVADSKPLATTWNAEKNEGIAWKTPIPGLAHSSPIVWGDRVFVSTAISSQADSDLKVGLYGDVEPSKDQSSHKFKLYALDKRTGKIVWEVTSYEGVPKTKRHTKSSYAAATPVTDGKNIVVLFGAEGMYCYDFTGKLIWKKDLGMLDAGWFYDPDYQWGTASSPVIYKDMVIVQADIQKDSFIAAYSLKDGKQIWKTMRDELPSWGTPTVYQGAPHDEIITQATKFSRGYDPMTGKELWKIGPNSEVTTPTPILTQGLFIITNGYQKLQPIYAIKPGASGDLTLAKGVESSDFVAWSHQADGPYMPTPVAYGDNLFICKNNGVIAVLDSKSGKVVFRDRLKHRGSGFSGSPVAGDGKVYFPSEDGDVFVVKANAKAEPLAQNPLGEVLMSSPAISDGMLFFRAQHTLFAIAPPAPAPAVPVK